MAALLVVGACRKSPQVDRVDLDQLIEVPPRTIPALPQQHLVEPAGELVAADLEHGAGAYRVVLRRRWLGKETGNATFGPGWGDDNLFRVALITPETILVSRSDAGWIVAHGAEGKFKSATGAEISRSGEEWVLRMPRSGATMRFDVDGKLVSRTGGEVTFNYKYDERNRLVEVGSSASNALRYQYDGSGRVTQVDGPEGLHARYSYDAEGRLAESTNDAGIKTTYRYDGAGVLLAARDQFGAEVEMARLANFITPADAREAATESTPGPAADVKTDGFGRITAIKTGRGELGVIEYNKLDLPMVIQTPTGSERFTYNRHGLLVRRETSAADWEEYRYDTNGRIVSVRRSPGVEDRLTYDERDQLVGIKTGAGREVTYGYDARGNRISEAWSTGEKSTWVYNARGELSELTDAAGLRIEFVYTPDGTLLEMHDPVHGRTRFGTSAEGRTVEREDVGKFTLKSTADGAPLSLLTPADQRTAFVLKENGLPAATITADRLAARYEYDAAQRLSRIALPGGGEIVLKRDEAGRLTEILRGDLVWRQFKHDSQGRLSEMFSSLGRSAKYEYGDDGRLRKVFGPNGEVTLEQAKEGVRQTLKGPGYELEQEFARDGELVRQHNKSAGLDLKFVRDQQGRAAGVELNQLKTGYGYDQRGQIERIELPGQKAIQLSRDDAGRIIRVALQSVAILELFYDRADRITGIKARTPAGAELFNEGYEFDKAGNISAIRTPGAAQRLEHDKVNRLLKWSDGKRTDEFRYDTGGNLTAAGSTHWLLDKLGRPQQQGVTTFSWDAGGNLARTENGLVRTENSFDAAGRLTQRQREKTTWRYGYLPNGDRLWRESAKGKAWFTYTDEALAAFKDESGTSWLVINLPGTDWPLALCGSNGKTYFIIADRLHSTRRFVNEAGAVIGRNEFGVFGKLEEQSGDTTFISYAGMLVDEGGLFYARQRYYDPALARFISIDPVEGSPANPASYNAYSYALNNPHRFRDPHGTQPWDLTKLTPAEFNLWHEFARRDPSMQEGLVQEWIRRDKLTRREMGLRPRAYSISPSGALNVQELGRAARPNATTVAVDAAELAARRKAPTIAGNVAEIAAKRNATTVSIESANAAARRNAVTVANQEAAELAARRAAPTMAVETAETAGRLMRGLRLLGRGLALAGAVGDALLAAENAHALATLVRAETEAGEAQRAARAARKALEEKLAETLRNNPGKLRPFPDGRVPDPNKPEDIDELLTQLHSNLTKNRKPLEGIVNTSPDPKEEALLANAMKKARALIATGNARLLAGRTLLQQIESGDDEALEAIAKLEQILAQQRLFADDAAAFPVAVDALKKSLGKLQAQTRAVKSAEAEMRAALSAGQSAEKQVCDRARQAGTATAEQLTAWRNEGQSAIFAASNGLKTAQEKIDAVALSIDELRTAEETLRGFQLRFALGGEAGQRAEQATTTAGVLFIKAQGLVQSLAAKRTQLDGVIRELNSLPDQVRALLMPVVSAPEAAALIAEGDDFDKAIAAPAANDLAPQVSALEGPVKLLHENKARIDRLVRDSNPAGLSASADAAIGEAEAAISSARSIAAAPEHYRLLQNASQCLAQLTAAKPAVAVSSPSPSASATAVAATDEVTVPDLSGASPSEMEAMLTRAGLKRSLVAAKDKPPSKEKEFKFASQSPAAGTKVKRGTTVAVAMYPKFEETVAVSDEVTVPDLSGYRETSEMQEVLSQAGLTGSLVVAKEKTPSKEREFKFAAQSPAAGTRVKRGSTVAISIYPSFEATVASDETNVPDLSVYATTSEMKAALTHAGLTATLVSAREKPPSKEKEFKLASQSPAPDTKVKKGSTVTIAIYQKYEGAEAAQTTGGVPSLIGLTLEQAREKLEAAGLKLGGTEVGTVKPPTAEDAYRVYAQEPAAGQSPPANKFVSVKQYSSAKSETPAVSNSGSTTSSGDGTGFAGTWETVNPVQGNKRSVLRLTQTSSGYTLVVDNLDISAAGKARSYFEGPNLVIAWEVDFAKMAPMPAESKVVKGMYIFTPAGDQLTVTGCLEDPKSGYRKCGEEGLPAAAPLRRKQ